MQDSKKLNKEISLISRYAGLKYSKYTLVLMLAFIYLQMGSTTPVYILMVAVSVPAFLGLAASISPDHKSKEGLLLPYTAGKYKFDITRYKNEKYGYISSCLLLLLWQAKINLYGLYSMPLKAVPAIVIIIYTLVRIITGVFIKYKIKYGFINLNM